eukprot:13745142-Ditylum_brightwellii.AAC.1
MGPNNFQDLVKDHASTVKFAEAVGVTDAVNLQDAKFQEFFKDVAKEAFVSATNAEKLNGISAELLECVWRIDTETAVKTLGVTNQWNCQSTDSTLSRQLGTNNRMLRYHIIKSFLLLDTFFVTKKAHNIREVSVPEALVCDAHLAQTYNEMNQFCCKIGTTLRILEESTQHANRAELYAGILKKASRIDMYKTHSWPVLWDYCVKRRALITNMTAKHIFQLQGQNPHFATFVEESDISNICQFG